MSVIQMPINTSPKNDEFSGHLIRQSHYLTGGLICVLDKITKAEHSKRDAVLRNLLSNAINEKYPGLLEEVADEGIALEKSEHDRLGKKLGLLDDDANTSRHRNHHNHTKSALKLQPKKK